MSSRIPRVGISSIFCKSTVSGEMTIVGREDGTIELRNGLVSSKEELSNQGEMGIKPIKVFDSEIDFENEAVKESILAIELKSTGTTNEILYLANEKNIKVIKVKDDFYNYENNHVTIANKVNAHRYITNSLSLNLSEEYMISSDLLRINLWKPERMESYFTLVDLKPQLTSGSVYVINSAKCSVFCENIYGYSTSRGTVELQDLNVKPLSSNIMSITTSSRKNDIRSVSDFTFTDENILATRTLNYISLFDIRNPISCLKEIKIMEYDRDSDEKYDKFKIINRNNLIFSGSYYNSVISVDAKGDRCEEIEICKESGSFTNNAEIPKNQSDTISSDSQDRIKLIVKTEDGFACVCNSKLYDIKT